MLVLDWWVVRVLGEVVVWMLLEVWEDQAAKEVQERQLEWVRRSG